MIKANKHLPVFVFLPSELSVHFVSLFGDWQVFTYGVSILHFVIYSRFQTLYNICMQMIFSPFCRLLKYSFLCYEKTNFMYTHFFILGEIFHGIESLFREFLIYL